MNRGQLMERCRNHGVTHPEKQTRDLTDERIEGSLDWYEHQKFTLGSKVTEGLLIWQFQQGGIEAFSPHDRNGAKREKQWWQDANARAAWADDHFPDEPDEAEAAVISLANAKKEITVDSVRKTIGFDREEDAAFYGGGAFETKLAPPSGGDSKAPWISHAVRKS